MGKQDSGGRGPVKGAPLGGATTVDNGAHACPGPAEGLRKTYPRTAAPKSEGLGCRYHALALSFVESWSLES